MHVRRMFARLVVSACATCASPLACKPAAGGPSAPSGPATVTLAPAPTNATSASPRVGRPKGVPCGAETCDGARRFCCWNHRTGSGRCTTYDDCASNPDDGISVSECAAPGDCDARTYCCFAPPAAALCASSPLMSRSPGTPIECGYGAFCETIGDCPKTVAQFDTWKLVGCKAGENPWGPPGAKGCVYAE